MTHELTVVYRDISGEPIVDGQIVATPIPAHSDTAVTQAVLEHHTNDIDTWRYLDEDPADNSDIDPETLLTAIDVCTFWIDRMDACDCDRPKYLTS